MASSSSSTRRATGLASAALASARSSRAQARASPRASLFGSFDRHRRRANRNENASTSVINEEADSQELGDDEPNDGLSSRQRRLSRAARFGLALPNNEISMLPSAWDAAVVRLLDEADKEMLRTDYLRRESGASSRSMTPQRLSVLHLTSASPHRYAASRTVLRQVRMRLGPDVEGAHSSALEDEWLPERIIEYGCGAGEGLWASAYVFGGEQDAERRITYEGYDAQGTLLHVAAEIIDAAKINSSVTLAERNLREEDKEDSALMKALAKMKISFATSLKSPKQGAKHQDSEFPAEPTSGSGTLIFCNHSLSAMSNDGARNAFVKSLWERHPTAEVIAFVEDGGEKGFACIASAREELLGIGRRSLEALEEEDEVSNRKPHQECHVVAPCPHDRPCPLLHDYEFAEAPSNPKIGKSLRSSSPLFHGASIGLSTCWSPLRIHVPTYTRLTRHEKRAEETARHSYLIVRRGPRPNMIKKAGQQAKNDGADAETVFREMRIRSSRTKEGIVEQLRTGSSIKQDIPLAEIVADDVQSSMAGVAAEDGEDEKAREELLRMLPEILRQQVDDAQQDGQDVPDAMRMAQSILEQSAEMADDGKADSTESKALAEQESLDLAGALLAQQRAAPEDEVQRVSEEDDGNTIFVDMLDKEDVEVMRMEAYEWPRLVRPALKRSGHVIVDACTAQGSINRFNLTRSMGKQVYQDVRKSSHGDLLPYRPVVEEPATWSSSSSSSSSSGTTRVKNVKSLLQSIPPASETARNSMTPNQKMKQTKKAKNRSGAKRFVAWPASSALAIGPDWVAADKITEASSHVAKSAAAIASSASRESFSRRSHYTSGQGRGAEQLQRARRPASAAASLDSAAAQGEAEFAHRESRKRSRSDYAEEANEGWSMPLEEKGEEGLKS